MQAYTQSSTLLLKPLCPSTSSFSSAPLPPRSSAAESEEMSSPNDIWFILGNQSLQGLANADQK
ncbi:hypothetical protein WDZ92_09620 [Nostoc sp. NIES-2111]